MENFPSAKADWYRTNVGPMALQFPLEVQMLHAVVIGINSYQDPRIPNLKYACADADSIARLIESAIHPEDRRVVLLRDSEANAVAIRRAIGEALPRMATAREDIVLLYFAGHGSPETDRYPVRASRYLVAHDTAYDSIFATAIDMEIELVNWFERIQEPQLIILFVDACFSGRAGGRTFEGPMLKKARARLRDGPIRLKELELGKGRAILSACDDDEVAEEMHDLGHGVFTHALVKVLSNKSTHRSISLASVYDQVRQQVRTRTARRQNPVLNGRAAGARLPLFYT
jgi:uncharacterized caspase-like protein